MRINSLSFIHPALVSNLVVLYVAGAYVLACSKGELKVRCKIHHRMIGITTGRFFLVVCFVLIFVAIIMLRWWKLKLLLIFRCFTFVHPSSPLFCVMFFFTFLLFFLHLLACMLLLLLLPFVPRTKFVSTAPLAHPFFFLIKLHYC